MPPTEKLRRVLEGRDDIRHALFLFEHAPDRGLDWIRLEIKDVRETLLNQPRQLDLMSWPGKWVGIGACALRQVLRESKGFNPDSFADLLMQKHEAYGPRPIR